MTSQTHWDRPAHRARAVSATGAACAALAVLLVLSVGLGPQGVHIGVHEELSVLVNHVPFLRGIPHVPASPEADVIVWQMRLPRALAAVLIGALLSYAGVAFQGLLMNPLADPYTVGVSAGAAVGAAIAEVAGVGAIGMGLGSAGVAFVAALAAVALVYSIARVGRRVPVQSFLLAGVVVGTFLWALIPLLLVVTGRADQTSRLLFYLIGSVQYADWTRAALLAPFAVLAAGCLHLWARELNLVTLGEETAAHLGVEIERFKVRVLVVGSLATAAAVSVGGIIGFVGLVVPHLARRIVGPDHRTLLPLAALFGAILLLASDTIVRVYLNEMPVGVVTSLVGAPVFCAILRRRQAAAW
ncbi:MAG: FecCD family ABC transporter permease [Chthonomonadales bacterium]